MLYFGQFCPISVPLMHVAPMHTSWYKLAVFYSSFVSSQMGPWIFCLMLGLTFYCFCIQDICLCQGDLGTKNPQPHLYSAHISPFHDQGLTLFHQNHYVKDVVELSIWLVSQLSFTYCKTLGSITDPLALWLKEKKCYCKVIIKAFWFSTWVMSLAVKDSNLLFLRGPSALGCQN